MEESSGERGRTDLMGLDGINFRKQITTYHHFSREGKSRVELCLLVFLNDKAVAINLDYLYARTSR